MSRPIPDLPHFLDIVKDIQRLRAKFVKLGHGEFVSMHVDWRQGDVLPPYWEVVASPDVEYEEDKHFGNSWVSGYPGVYVNEKKIAFQLLAAACDAYVEEAVYVKQH